MASEGILRPAPSLAALLLCLAVTGALAQAVTADHFRQSHFRGFNFAEVKDGVPRVADLDALHDTGANLGRVFFGISRCRICLSYSIDPDDLKTLDSLVAAVNKRSIHLVVVLTLGGDERGLLWWSTSLQDSFVEVWRQLATRYKGVVTIAGFDLLNEPVPPGKTYDERQATWLTYAERLGAAIRAADPERVLIVESAPDAMPPTFANLRPLGLTNVVYSVHSYFPMALTHQGVMKPYEDAVVYAPSPEAEHGRRELYGYLEQVAAFAKRYDVPILVGEFSCVRWAPQHGAERYVADSLEFFESHGWSWTYHEYRRWNGWDAEMRPGTPEETERSTSAPVMTLLRARLQAPH
jgi:hypothetical protein